MLRRGAALLIGVQSDIFMSVVKDKKYLEHRLALLGKEDPAQKPRPLSPEEIQRFTTSVGSAESLFNKASDAMPSNVVDEATGVPFGSTQLNPTRYGDWEGNGRCHDF
ncbi:hypothetical protein TraAM80_06351 [Trypanosoma rangeli]|uniref:Succinate dehydrogenase assembly factor 4, mitochondrial n=1 Tax=Trypanosoma rangeli TaxID=5698 RepID=A0A3R7NGX7_TRYRA|nr:uncharacterized protein TraAM80_06351 [Trypanosoma rangeli]RNF02526.1 hypothetical protein TraAM80_06351 [Trypanosoma rangeli]|eukprot:RNF02526.1 hypothetical protein TraAM80_06351 [Trypanosoma rangeli]